MVVIRDSRRISIPELPLKSRDVLTCSCATRGDESALGSQTPELLAWRNEELWTGLDGGSDFDFGCGRGLRTAIRNG